MDGSHTLKEVHALLEDGVTRFERSMLVLIGDRTRRVRDLYTILQRCLGGRPKILWCYKSELKFSSSRKKHLKKASGTENMPVQWCYYRDTRRILGQTFGMVVLQDFLPSPNVMCRAVETVQGGGLIVFMVKSAQSLTQLHDIDSGSRFTGRFIMSITRCERCLIIDDELNVLPLARTRPFNTKRACYEENPDVAELRSVAELAKTNNRVIEVAKTLDQAHAIQEMVDFACADRKGRNRDVRCCALTAPRGRGKSSALGLSLAAILSFCDCRKIIVTAPCLENVKGIFEFALKGLEKLCFVEHVDYTISKNCLRFKSSSVRYCCPDDAIRIAQMVDLMVVDEAAAIPIPKVERLLAGEGRSIVSSTVSGYEGTGHSLQLKLLQKLKRHDALISEITLETPIRYSQSDPVEKWLNETFCLSNSNREVQSKSRSLPALSSCGLFHVDRNALFSHHRKAELFLQKVMGLFAEAHYKNTPNDLQLIADAPKHRLFVLLEKDILDSKVVPEVLVAIHVALEGSMAPSRVKSSLASGDQGEGDLIPWTVAQQCSATCFPKLSGARIVRIAARPDLQGMGYGTKALQNLAEFLQSAKSNTTGIETFQDFEDSSECRLLYLQDGSTQPSVPLPPLLLPIERIISPHVDWIGVSFGLINDLLTFWLRNGFSVVHFRQVQNDLTGHHNIILLRQRSGSTWLEEMVLDMRRRIIRLFPFSCLNSLAISTCLNLVGANGRRKQSRPFNICQHLSGQDIARLRQYAGGSGDHQLVADIMPVLAELIFNGHVDVELSELHSAVLLGLALQRREVESVASEMDLSCSQVLAIHAKLSRKILDTSLASYS